MVVQQHFLNLLENQILRFIFKLYLSVSVKSPVLFEPGFFLYFVKVKYLYVSFLKQVKIQSKFLRLLSFGALNR